MTPHKLVSVVGARPQFVKAAAVSRAIGRTALDEVVVHTGQHYDEAMSDVFFRELKMSEPAYHLGVGSGSHGAQTARAISALETVLLEERPDVVVLYGDTNSTLAGAIAASKLSIPIAHVEAGLRSFDMTMPEEINRVLTDRVSSLLLCPSETSVGHLRAEGITRGVHLVGDVMYDAYLWAQSIAPDGRDLADAYGLPPGRFALATIHRAANTDSRERFDRILSGLRGVARHMPVLWPVHPRVSAAGREIDIPGVHLCAPLPYLEMTALLGACAVVLTDSGGLQKEALWAKRSCVTLRAETEWPETVEMGWNHLVDDDPEAIVAAALTDAPAMDPAPVYGDGDAATTIVDLLATFEIEGPR